MTEGLAGDDVAIEPDLPIVDPHHHLWDGIAALGPRGGRRYHTPDLLADLGAGHRIVQTVAIECGAHYFADGPESLRPVGETLFFLGSAKGASPGLCAGIVGHADLQLGDAVAPVLEAHVDAGEGRFRGIRQSANRDDDPLFDNWPRRPPPGLLADPGFRAGFARLAPLGLSFDAWIFHPQIGELADLAAAFPDTAIILDHVGGLLGIGNHGTRPAETFALWRDGMARLAARPNALVKIGGLGMPFAGSPLHMREPPATVDELVAAWRPVVETCVELFGADRCMFESNFPVDSATCSYVRLWNAFKRISAGWSADERAALFAGTARRAYRLPEASEAISPPAAARAAPDRS
ncbi:amidohydrolase family protein [Sphingomonas sp. C8-2]|jgi:predicted TIM-barrel fold metal-dependent hydrolase|uniref:Predicted metal-dependent hydrolase, TIM-barrel fold n=1 Tax=Rhizorhabdus histidinilytica TaxID=439228 RepID=A0A1T5G1F5_9SPHN|nr:amidohydrolase family protein [Rhizorhabdus histidinilytica]QEH81513.1 amidohydrolase family protein [Sphingomonas sp. C8-2]SKC02182.1 Predicted metal-dependent hydrolase, TIM-barrel fold [Rhizorhabdus histidinilytica]